MDDRATSDFCVKAEILIYVSVKDMSQFKLAYVIYFHYFSVCLKGQTVIYDSFVSMSLVLHGSCKCYLVLMSLGLFYF